MQYQSHSDDNILIQTSGCLDSEGIALESCSVLSLRDAMMPFREQMELLLENLHGVISSCGTLVFVRFFLSDPANQAAVLKGRLDLDCPVSVIGQTPLNGTKIAAMVWCRRAAAVARLSDRMYKVTERGVDEYWYTGGLSDADGSYGQTVALLDDLAGSLQAQGLTLRDNCMRTWLFVQNIDVNYKGVVDGRNDVFDNHDLTACTHFISSTGIEGRTANHINKVMLDAVAVSGPGVGVKFLYGQSHLNRTSEYGVRFERGTEIDYPDRKHVYISGTASIDNKGQIMYEGDIVRQTARMIENVEVLLSESGCGFADVAAMTVYLRDPSDYAVVNRIFSERFPNHPRIITQAPVCRPGWLIEMECVAISC